MHITLHKIWFRIRDHIFQINQTVQAFLFPCISDLYVVNIWQVQRNNDKASYFMVNGFGEKEDIELERNSYD